MYREREMCLCIYVYVYIYIYIYIYICSASCIGVVHAMGSFRAPLFRGPLVISLFSLI